jgi:glutathione peroxidase
VLAELHKRYRQRGFQVLGFPCNDFAAEEPDDLPTIKRFCAVTFGVAYELFDKVHIRPPQTHPLYAWLERNAPTPGPVSWNFEKFLVDRRGAVVGRWAPRVAPDAPEVVAAIERALAEPA